MEGTTDILSVVEQRYCNLDFDVRPPEFFLKSHQEKRTKERLPHALCLQLPQLFPGVRCLHGSELKLRLRRRRRSNGLSLPESGELDLAAVE